MAAAASTDGHGQLRVGVTSTLVGNSLQPNHMDVWSLMNMYCGPLQFIPKLIWDPNNTNYHFLAVKDGLLDSVTSWWAHSQYRAQFVQYSMPLTQTSIMLVVFTDDTTESGYDQWYMPTSSINVYSPTMWAVLISVAALFITLIMFQTYFVVDVHRRRQISMEGYEPLGAWHWLGHYWLEYTHSYTGPSPVSARTIIVLTGIFTMHSLVLYQGILLTKIMVNEPLKLPASTFDGVADLILSGKAVLNLVDRERISTLLVLNADDDDPAFGRLKQALQYNPPLFMDDDDHEAIKHVTGEVTIITVNTEDAAIEAAHLDDCDFTMVDTGIRLQKSFIFGPMVNQSYIDCFNDIIMQNLTMITSLLQIHTSGQYKEYGSCRQRAMEEQSTNAGDPIPLVRISGSFVVWAGGLVIGVAVFAMEKCRTTLRRSRVIDVFSDVYM